jgi:L-ascorbate metabolism protein UlaG (beta-lactamase superfamily)
MLTDSQMQQAIKNLDLLIANINTTAPYFSLVGEKLSKNWFFKSHSSHQERIKRYLESVIDEVSPPNADFNNRIRATLFIAVQNFLHFQPNKLLESLQLNLQNKEQLLRKNLTIEKLSHVHANNQFKDAIIVDALPRINYDLRTGLYTSPDDNKAHQHHSEARRIFVSTQWERFKGFCNWLFAKIGIHFFETARYREHDYLDSEVYAHDLAIEPKLNKQANHYWVGHATNFITLPTRDSSLHILTDPVEGDLAPLFYPRMTKEPNLIDGIGDKKLPKVDVVLISHNHRDHLSISTLERLLKQQPQMVVPEGDESLFLNMGFTNVVGLKWWEQALIKDARGFELLKITAVPARHWSGRTVGDAHRSAFNGYVLHSFGFEGDIYFAGDTAVMDELCNPIFDNFDIVTAIQPGGPDERRADMESTHQSSADAILMHFKMLTALYRKMKREGDVNQEINFAEFMGRSIEIKTIYNHTATFKLGNLHLKDTYYSYQRLVAAPRETSQWRREHLTEHEHKVYNSIVSLVDEWIFEGQVKLMPVGIANLILQGIVIPKIGQKQLLKGEREPSYSQSFQYRHLITNHRALLEFDRYMQNYLATENTFNLNKIILGLLNGYQRPWHAPLTRTYQKLGPYLQLINNCRNHSQLWYVLSSMEESMGQRNQHGHLQSLLHYAKWLLKFSYSADNPEQVLQKFKEYFTCQKVRKSVDQEIHHSRGLLGGKDRQITQQVFTRLSDLLADLPSETGQYQEVIENWLASPSKDNHTTTREFLGKSHLAFFSSVDLNNTNQVRDGQPLASPNSDSHQLV